MKARITKLMQYGRRLDNPQTIEAEFSMDMLSASSSEHGPREKITSAYALHTNDTGTFRVLIDLEDARVLLVSAHSMRIGGICHELFGGKLRAFYCEWNVQPIP